MENDTCSSMTIEHDDFPELFTYVKLTTDKCD